MKILIPSLIWSLLAGCSIPLKTDGTTYHLIIGLGLVATNAQNTDAVIATRINALGISVSNQTGLNLGVGYSSSKTVSMKEGAGNLVVEIEDKLNGDVTVTMDQAPVNNGDDVDEMR